MEIGTNTAAASGAPGEFTLDGQTYRMSPMTDRDLGELDNHLRKAIIRTARDSLEDSDPPRVREEILDAALRVAHRVSWIRDSKLDTVLGTARFLWQVVYRNHPGITVEALAEAIRRDPSGVADAMETFAMLNPVRSKKNTMGPAAAEPALPTIGAPSTSP